MVNQGTADGGGDMALASATWAEGQGGGTGPDAVLAAGQGEELALANVRGGLEVEGGEGSSRGCRDGSALGRAVA